MVPKVAPVVPPTARVATQTLTPRRRAGRWTVPATPRDHTVVAMADSIDGDPVILAGRFETRKLLKRGALATTFLGHDRLAGDDVVIKLMAADVPSGAR